MKKLQEDIENIKTTIQKQNDTSSNVGYIYLRGTTINVYTRKGDTISTNIDSVIFSIANGKLPKNLLYIQTEIGRFYNKKKLDTIS